MLTNTTPAGAAPQKKRFVFASLTLGCLLVDLAVLFGVIEGVRWLIETLSPLALAGTLVVTILAARMAFFVYAGLRTARDELAQVTAS